VKGGVYLVKGNDSLLRDRAADDLVNELLGDDDRTLALEEFHLPEGGGDAEDDVRAQLVAAALNAATSPPFMTSRRVVVLRNVGALKAETAAPIERYLDAPLETSVVVLVTGGGTIPASLAKKLKDVGAGERAPRSEKTSDVLANALAAASLQLRPEALARVTAHLGEDAGRVAALVDVLLAAHGEGARLGVDDVEPYLGEAGAVPSYGLTNAIEAGDSAAALEVLHRLLSAANARDRRPMHPLQVLGSLNSYYRRLLRLDDSSVRGTEDAIAALGGRVSQYPARKALAAARALGTTGIRQAFDWLHQADLDLKGARGIPSDAVMEVLVVRLARLSRSAAPATAARRR
jgi:DNA polymerase-3 subunit delta